MVWSDVEGSSILQRGKKYRNKRKIRRRKTRKEEEEEEMYGNLKITVRGKEGNSDKSYKRD